MLTVRNSLKARQFKVWSAHILNSNPGLPIGYGMLVFFCRKSTGFSINWNNKHHGHLSPTGTLWAKIWIQTLLLKKKRTPSVLHVGDTYELGKTIKLWYLHVKGLMTFEKDTLTKIIHAWVSNTVRQVYIITSHANILFILEVFWSTLNTRICSNVIKWLRINTI
jgi:hypothetical protein